MKQIRVYNPATEQVIKLPLGFTEEDVANVSPDRLKRLNYFVVKLEPTTDIWKD